jgi:hypothetical protein
MAIAEKPTLATEKREENAHESHRQKRLRLPTSAVGALIA